MRGVLFLIFTIAAMYVHAQQFYFPKENYKDSVTLAATMPALAAQVKEVYKESDKELYFDDMFRFALVAKQYDSARAYIDSLRVLIAAGDSLTVKGISFQYESFAKAKKQQQQTGDTAFKKIFNQIFQQGYDQLSAKAKTIASQYITEPTQPLKDDLDKAIAKQKTSDTITLDDAFRLLYAFNRYNVYSQTQQVMQAIVIEEDSKVFSVNSTLIKTKDGGLVQALVVRKKDTKQKLPTVFIFNIYIDSSHDVSICKQYALANFACVVANTRGKGRSPQTIEPFEHDASDAYDIIDWISKQKWSNGKVGMTGGSYLGFSQWAAAKTLHPALKTIMPEVAVGIGIDYPMYGNIFMNYMLRWIHYVTNSKQTDYADFNNNAHWDSVFKAWYQKGSSFRSLDTLEGRPSLIFQRWLQHPSFDSYWQNMTSYNTDFARINIPVLTTTGYFDADQSGAMYYYCQHYLHNANNYLVIGPYNHGGAQSYPAKELNGYSVDSVATAFNFVDLSVEWFNYVLKDSAKPALLKDKVNYEVMDANEWRHAPSIAGMSNDTLTFYLSNTRLNEHYKLDTTANADEYIKQEVDFKDRTDTSDYSFKTIDTTLYLDNSLSFISQPVDKPFIISGSFTSSVKAAINKKDVDLAINMYEQMPDGKYFALGSTYQRASYANDRSNRQLLHPDQKETIPINHSFITCKQLSKGSRIILVIGVNKQRDWQINYGTGKEVSDETIKDANEPLEIKWFCDSFIKVPVLK